MKKLSLLIFILPIFYFTSCSYLPEELPTTPGLVIEENADYISLTTANTDNRKAGIVFNPGGLVDPHAYITAFEDFALIENRMVLIAKVTSNLAILNTSKASSIINDMTDVNRWVVGGHSLGGVTSCIDVFNNPDSFVGLFILAAYSIEDLRDSSIPIISITASEDALLDMEEFSNNNDNLPDPLRINAPIDIPEEGTSGMTVFYQIEGGNHAQFGSYGNQEGDGSATISSIEQQELTFNVLKKFMDCNEL